METNRLAQKKKKKGFYLLIKLSNLNIYKNQNGKSMFPNWIDRFGRQKRETIQQQTNKEKPRKKIKTK